MACCLEIEIDKGYIFLPVFQLKFFIRLLRGYNRITYFFSFHSSHPFVASVAVKKRVPFMAVNS